MLPLFFLSQEPNSKLSLNFSADPFHDSQAVKFLLDTRERLNTRKTSTADSVTAENEPDLDPIQASCFLVIDSLAYMSSQNNSPVTILPYFALMIIRHICVFYKAFLFCLLFGKKHVTITIIIIYSWFSFVTCTYLKRLGKCLLRLSCFLEKLIQTGDISATL